MSNMIVDAGNEGRIHIIGNGDYRSRHTELSKRAENERRSCRKNKRKSIMDFLLGLRDRYEESEEMILAAIGIFMLSLFAAPIVGTAFILRDERFIGQRVIGIILLVVGIIFMMKYLY